MRIFKLLAVTTATIIGLAAAGFAQTVTYASAQVNDSNSNSIAVNQAGNDIHTDFTGLTKTISKTYPANSNDKLLIENIFGKITVNTWNKSEFKVDVEIKISASDPVAQQQRFDRLTIENSKQGNDVSFKTNLGTGGPSNGTNTVEVNYTIYMPLKNALTIKNEFGIIVLPDMPGKLDIMSMFGGLIAKSLSNPENVIQIHNGNITSTIEYLKATDLNVELSNLDLNNADQLHASISFGKTRIGHITSSARISVSHGSSFEVEGIDKNVRLLNIEASFTNIKLKFNGDFNGEYDVNATNGNFNYSKSNSRGPAPASRAGWNNSHSYSGPIGKGDRDRIVNINASFGNVTFD